MGRFFKEILSGFGGEWSSKRVITFLAFILMALAFISNLYWGFTIASFMYESMSFIVMFGIGAATAEPLANSKLLNKCDKKDED